MQETKDKVQDAISTYKELYPEEYKLFSDSTEEKRNINDDYGQFSEDGIIERVVYELPERLYNIIEKQLTSAEFTVFSGKEFTRWFINNYPEFKSIQNV